MDNGKSASELTYGTVAPLPMAALAGQIPAIVTTIGILWFADFPRAEWPFAVLVFWIFRPVGHLLTLLPILLILLPFLLLKRRWPKFDSRSIFNPEIDPETSAVSVSEAVQSRKIGAVIGALSRGIVAWCVVLIGSAQFAPLIGLSPLNLSIGMFAVAALCLVLSAILVSLGTASLGFYLSDDRTDELWRQLWLTHSLQFLGIINWPSYGRP